MRRLLQHDGELGVRRGGVLAAGPTGRLFFTALYNLVDSDRPVVSLGVGEQDVAPGYLSRYQTAAAGVHYLFKRNVRFMGETGWDFEREQMRFTIGTVLAF
jgi:hypothetical protein